MNYEVFHMSINSISYHIIPLYLFLLFKVIVFFAYIVKRVHRYPHCQIRGYLLTYLGSAERAFIGGDYYSMMHFYGNITTCLCHS